MLVSSQPMRVISKQEAIQIRMLNQQLLSPLYERPEDIVAWQGAMQAQDYNYFRWAIGIRQRTPQLVGLQEAFTKTELLRLHLLRCKERNLRTLQSWHKSINVSFSESYFEEITRAMQELLAGGKSLPKKAIAEKLTTLGFLLDDRLLTSLLVRMEIEGLLCSGEMQGREATWALLSERVPTICSLTPEEALKQLALKYFRSHSPASLEDFVWWSGLPKTQCRKALALIAPEIEEIKVEEEEEMMYLYHNTLDCPDYAKMVLLLPPYDEYLIGYKSRWVALEKKHTAKAHNNFGIFNPVILHEGRVVGNWKASIDKQAANLTIDFFAEKSKIGKRNLQGAVNQFVEFCKVTANRAS